MLYSVVHLLVLCLLAVHSATVLLYTRKSFFTPENPHKGVCCWASIKFFWWWWLNSSVRVGGLLCLIKQYVEQILNTQTSIRKLAQKYNLYCMSAVPTLCPGICTLHRNLFPRCTQWTLMAESGIMVTELSGSVRDEVEGTEARKTPELTLTHVNTQWTLLGPKLLKDW